MLSSRAITQVTYRRYQIIACKIDSLASQYIYIFLYICIYVVQYTHQANMFAYKEHACLYMYSEKDCISIFYFIFCF